MAEIVKITCGQPFVVYLPLVILNADGSKEAVDASRLTDVAVKLQAQGMDDVAVTTEAYEQYLVLNIPGTMPVAEYNIIVNATLPNSRPFTLRMSRALGVMAWDWQTNWRDYLVGEHIELCDQPFIAGEFTTDAEYEALKQQLREQIAAAEQAEAEAIAEKEQYAEALEHLDDIAQETSVEGIADSIGVPATGQPGTLFAAIAAGGSGGGGDAQESTSQAILAAVQSGNLTAIAELLNNAHGLDALRTLIAAIPTTAPATPQNVNDAKDAVIAAIPSVSGLATEANATVNKQAVLNALTAAEAALQGGDQTATLTALKQAVAAIVIPTDYAKETTAQAAATDAAAAKVAAQGITGYALQGSGNATQTDIASAIGTPATGQPSTLFAAIAAGGGGGGGGGDATAANQQIIIGAVKDGNDTTIDVVKDIDTYGAKEAAATTNKNQVISAIGDTLSVNMLATGLSAMAGVPMNVVTDDGTTAYTLNANELYYFNNRSSDLELTLDLTTVNPGDAADFHLIVQVDASASPLTVTIKDSDDNDVVWSWGISPDFSAGVIYEIGIINNLALYANYVV